MPATSSQAVLKAKEPLSARTENRVLDLGKEDPLKISVAERIEDNRKVATRFAQEDVRHLVWKNAQIIPPSTVIDNVVLGASGAHRTFDGNLKFDRLGPPASLVELIAYGVKERTWSLRENAQHFQPFRVGTLRTTNETFTVLPIAGKFHVAGRELMDDELRRCGIEPYRREDGSPLTFPAVRQGGRGYIVFGSFGFPAQRSDGSYEFVTGIAVQFRGVGGRYNMHLAAKDKDGVAQLHPDDKLLSGDALRGIEEEHAFVRRPHYFKKSGIFLDMQHEFYGASPTGAHAGVDALKDVELDALLWKKGATMAGVTVDSLQIVSRELVEQATRQSLPPFWSDIRASVRIIFEDTHRLRDLFIEEPRADGMPTDPFLKLITRDDKKYSEKLRGKYLDNICRTVGENMRICQECGLTLKRDLVSSDNLGVYGGIFDSENFKRMDHRYQLLPLVSLWLRDIANVAKHCGLSKREFIEGPHCRTLLCRFLGTEGAANVLNAFSEYKKRSSEKQRSSLSMLASLAATERIVQSLKAEGKELNVDQIINAVNSDRNVHRFLHLPENTRLTRNGSRIIESVSEQNGKRLARVFEDGYIEPLCRDYITLLLSTHQVYLGDSANGTVRYRAPLVEEVRTN